VISIFFCPQCGNEVIRSYPSGKIKMRTNIVIFEEDKCICKCLKCHAEVEVPVVLYLPTGKVVGYSGLGNSKKPEKIEKKK